jgi:hypothetical protein
MLTDNIQKTSLNTIHKINSVAKMMDHNEKKNKEIIINNGKQLQFIKENVLNIFKDMRTQEFYLT